MGDIGCSAGRSRVDTSGFVFQGLGCGVEVLGLGFKDKVLGFRVWGLG